MICSIIRFILGPILIPYNDAPIIMPLLNHMIWIGLIVRARVKRALAPTIKSLYTNCRLLILISYSKSFIIIFYFSVYFNLMKTSNKARLTLTISPI
ncbi:hypothetical protein ACN42_g11994 [Penicillium freii]|uniref:Uncharacterized protein n=1 Tax=Penicillium freii TaxID=48697 RepID=A0A117NK03_PENFR|nr:hypothetical protein ACN42_g11994 [Penicillium freii]